MDDQRFVYDSTEATAATRRAAEHARERDDVTVIDVAADRTRREAIETYDRRDVVDTYRELVAAGPALLDNVMETLAEADPAEGIFVGQVDGERQVVTGDRALKALTE